MNEHIGFLKRNINILIYIASLKEYQITIDFLTKKYKTTTFHIREMEYCLTEIGFYQAIIVKGGNNGDNAANGSSAIISKAINDFPNIKYLVTVGVCASLSSEVEIGDVVIANQILDYDSTRESFAGPIDRSFSLISNQSGNILSAQISTMNFVDFKVKHGKIVSGAKLVDNKKFVQKILNLHKEALALDMEGFSIAKTAVSNHLTDWFFIKSATDRAFKKQGQLNQEKGMYHALEVMVSLFKVPGFFLIPRVNVMISGAFSPDLGEKTRAVETFSYKLTQELIRNNYKIINGYGMCIGNAVIAASYKSINYADSSSSLENYLEVYPFPLLTDETLYTTLRTIKTENRQLMSRKCSFCIFIYGLKKDNNYPTGMDEEFHTAKQCGAYLVPVGATGYKARELWNVVRENLPEYYPHIYKDNTFNSLFDKLNNSNKDLEIIESILTFINFLSKSAFFSSNNDSTSPV